MIGREEELDRVIQILSRRTKNNPALIGEPGVGKDCGGGGAGPGHRRRRRPGPSAGQAGVRPGPVRHGGGNQVPGEFEEKLKHVLPGGAPGREYYPFYR